MEKHWAQKSEFAKVTGVGDRALKESTASAAWSAHTFCTASDAGPRNPGEALPTHFPGGSLSPCPSIALLSLLTTVSLDPQSQMVTIKRAGESAHSSLHLQHLQLLGKSCTIKQRQWAKHGTGVVLSLFTGQSSFALLSDSKKFQNKETKKHGWGGKRVRKSDYKWDAVFGMYHLASGKLLTPPWSLSNLIKPSAMPTAKACWNHLTFWISWNENRHITSYERTFFLLALSPWPSCS